MINTIRPKTQLVREHLLSLRDGVIFTAHGVTEYVGVELKDVNNVILRLTQGGALTRKRGDDRRYIYTVNANNVAAYFAKYPQDYNGVPPPKRDKKPSRISVAREKLARRKNRSQLAIAIDTEVAELETSIKKLKAFRREYAS